MSNLTPTVQDRIIATIKTGVPALWGLAIVWLIGRFPVVQDILVWLTSVIGLDAATVIQLVLTAAVIALYYWLASKIGARFPRVQRWLLGSSLIPTYK
jgi:hypothetical protein